MDGPRTLQVSPESLWLPSQSFTDTHSELERQAILKTLDGRPSLQQRGKTQLQYIFLSW